MSNMSNITPSDDETSLRKHIHDYSINQAEGPYKDFIRGLGKAFDEFNALYFDNSLTPAHIAITQPNSRHALADCSVFSGHGGKHQIRIKESVIDGTHNRFNPNHAIENRWLYILDVLLHELNHHFVHEILNDYSDSYGGHGVNYTKRANQIGDQLGLPHVVERNRKDKKSLPISSQWPLNVRPAGYYGDLLKVKEPTNEPEEPEDEPEPEPDFLALAIEAYRSLEAALSKLVPEQYDAFFEATGFPMPNLVTVNDDKVDPPVEPAEPVETKPVVKTRKVKKSKSSSPVGCLSQIEVVKAIKVSFSEFKNLLEQNLFPQPDMSDKNTGTGYWSDFVVENWLKNNPKS